MGVTKTFPLSLKSLSQDPIHPPPFPFAFFSFYSFLSLGQNIHIYKTEPRVECLNLTWRNSISVITLEQIETRGNSGSIIMATTATSSQISSPRISQQTAGSSVASSNVFVINALEKVATAREARRNKPLKEAVDTALSRI